MSDSSKKVIRPFSYEEAWIQSEMIKKLTELLNRGFAPTGEYHGTH